MKCPFIDRRSCTGRENIKIILRIWKDSLAYPDEFWKNVGSTVFLHIYPTSLISPIVHPCTSSHRSSLPLFSFNTIKVSPTDPTVFELCVCSMFLYFIFSCFRVFFWSFCHFTCMKGQSQVWHTYIPPLITHAIIEQSLNIPILHLLAQQLRQKDMFTCTLIHKSWKISSASVMEFHWRCCRVDRTKPLIWNWEFENFLIQSLSTLRKLWLFFLKQAPRLSYFVFIIYVDDICPAASLARIR